MRKLNLFWILVLVCAIWLAGGCSLTQKEVSPVKAPEATLTPTVASTSTPSPQNTGGGELKITYLHTIEGGKFNVLAEIPFKIVWNGQLGVWQAKSEKVVGRGVGEIGTSAMSCNAMFAPYIYMSSGVIVPPNPLKILGDCKMVANFRNEYEDFEWTCSNGINFMNGATTSSVGPITFDLRIGSRQSATGNPGEAWNSIYEYTITNLSLPAIYLLPYCDTTGSLEQTIP